jgi:hypothetical protein
MLLLSSSVQCSVVTFYRLAKKNEGLGPACNSVAMQAKLPRCCSVSYEGIETLL